MRIEVPLLRRLVEAVGRHECGSPPESRGDHFPYSADSVPGGTDCPNGQPSSNVEGEDTDKGAQDDMHGSGSLILGGEGR